MHWGSLHKRCTGCVIELLLYSIHQRFTTEYAKSKSPCTRLSSTRTCTMCRLAIVCICLCFTKLTASSRERLKSFRVFTARHVDDTSSLCGPCMCIHIRKAYVHKHSYSHPPVPLIHVAHPCVCTSCDRYLQLLQSDSAFKVYLDAHTRVSSPRRQGHWP